MNETQSLATQVERAPDEEARRILAAQRDPACFEGIYTRWSVPVYQYFYFRTGNAPNAEDLTSQLFLAVYEALPRYRHQGHFAAWLFSIARNLSREYYRKQAREAPLEHARQMSAAGDMTAELANAEEIGRLKALVHRLPEEEQELIRLRYVAELSFADMAIVLKKREDAVKKSLYRLQARLQSLLEQDHA
jgi:RNA polymerase sigma-70 factor, ECF subfamily